MIATDHAAAFREGGTCRARLEGLRLLPRRQQVLLAADWAEAALPVWEGAHPDDPWPRRAIEAARSGGKDAADAAYANAANAAHAAYAAYANAVYAAADAAYANANAAYAAANAACAAANAACAAANAAYADANAAYAASHAAHADANAADWSAVRRLWESAYHGGHGWHRGWGTPLAVELARDPQTYQILLDHLEDQGVPVGGLRGHGWARSNWAIYHLLEGKS